MGTEPQRIDTAAAGRLGAQVRVWLEEGRGEDAVAVLAPVLAARTAFPVLGRIGERVGEGPLSVVNPFLQQIADGRSMGGWVVIGAALGMQLERDGEGAMQRCQATVISADSWYGADILGERVPGPLLVADLGRGMALIDSWRSHPVHWVRRVTGVAVHYWAKRSRGEARFREGAAALLDFLEPLFCEREVQAIKGIGWGLKTIGKYYPDLLTPWLARKVCVAPRGYRALMLRKAVTYLGRDERARIRAASAS